MADNRRTIVASITENMTIVRIPTISHLFPLYLP